LIIAIESILELIPHQLCTVLMFRLKMTSTPSNNEWIKMGQGQVEVAFDKKVSG
jgi:predicted SprT family Zn-dependent metalloprotease